MRLLDLKNHLKLWKRVALTTIGCGNKVASARLYALSMLIKSEINFGPEWYEDGQEVLDFLNDLYEVAKFATRWEVTAKEKVIFLYIIMDWCDGKLREIAEWEGRNRDYAPIPAVTEPTPEPSEPAGDWGDGKHFDEPYPTEDDPNRLLGEIPF